MAADKKNTISSINIGLRVNKETVIMREPLSTILEESECISEIENLAGPSDQTVVIHRNNEFSEELDWKFEVFKDSASKETKTTKQKGDSHNDIDQLLNTAATEAIIKNQQARPASSIVHLSTEYVMDNLNYMLKSERKFGVAPLVKSDSRSNVINWIIIINEDSGSPQVIHLACWYLDRYLASTAVAPTRLPIIAAACFWIATKLHKRSTSSYRLVRNLEYAFSVEDLLATERSILRKLRFPPLPVTVYDFIPYLSWCCEQSSSGVVEAASLFLYECALLTNKTLHQEYPSVVAAAAVINAVMLLRQDVWFEKLKQDPIFKEAKTKTRHLEKLCTALREAVYIVAADDYEYKATLYKFAAPPYYIATRIVRLVKEVR